MENKIELKVKEILKDIESQKLNTFSEKNQWAFDKYGLVFSSKKEDMTGKELSQVWLKDIICCAERLLSTTNIDTVSFKSKDGADKTILSSELEALKKALK